MVYLKFINRQNTRTFYNFFDCDKMFILLIFNPLKNEQNQANTSLILLSKSAVYIKCCLFVVSQCELCVFAVATCTSSSRRTSTKGSASASSGGSPSRWCSVCDCCTERTSYTATSSRYVVSYLIHIQGVQK